MNRIKKFFNWVLGVCPHHKGFFNYPKKYQRHTAYEDEEKNWGFACKHCQKEDHETMEQMWSEYYNSIL